MSAFNELAKRVTLAAFFLSVFATAQDSEEEKISYTPLLEIIVENSTDHPTPEEAQQKFWDGLKKNDVALVERALSQGADPNISFDNNWCNDTGRFLLGETTNLYREPRMQENCLTPLLEVLHLPLLLGTMALGEFGTTHDLHNTVLLFKYGFLPYAVIANVINFYACCARNYKAKRINRMIKTFPPLFRNNNPAIVKALIDHGVPVDTTDSNENTALMNALQQWFAANDVDYEECRRKIIILTLAGANLNFFNIHGQTPFMIPYGEVKNLMRDLRRFRNDTQAFLSVLKNLLQPDGFLDGKLPKAIAENIAHYLLPPPRFQTNGRDRKSVESEDLCWMIQSLVKQDLSLAEIISPAWLEQMYKIIHTESECLKFDDTIVKNSDPDLFDF